MTEDASSVAAPGSDPGASTPLRELVRTSGAVRDTSARTGKVRTLADLLGRIPPEEAPVAVAYLSGELPEGPVGVGPATLDDVLPVPPAERATLTLRDVARAFDELRAIEGAGSRERRKERLRRLFGAATAAEQRFLAHLLLGELRQGAGRGLVVEALAEASGVRSERIREAVMLEGDAGAVARKALGGGPEALEELGIEVFRPVRPMLAQTADGVDEALERLDRAAIEYKLDGARIQVHRSGREVRVYTRSLNDETEALPEIVEAVRKIEVDEVVLDGEALAVRPDGSPRRFQTTMRRFGRRSDVESVRRELPLTAFFFDCLLLDGRSLVDRPGAERFRALRDVVPPELRVPRMVTRERDEAAAFFREAVAAGHEGVIAKSLDAVYSAGRRGRSWLKVKPVRTADLVVLAAEWGHGRRRGWLSNLHLGARSDGPDRFVMVGKTFKGMTDEMLEWQTRRLLELEERREGRTVHVRPELVAEVAFDGVQRSPTYDGGVALRFARIREYRSDKRPAEAETIERLSAIERGRDGHGRGGPGAVEEERR